MSKMSVKLAPSSDESRYGKSVEKVEKEFLDLAHVNRNNPADLKDVELS